MDNAIEQIQEVVKMMLANAMEYSAAALILYVAIGFVLLSLATIAGASLATKQRIPKASASATAIGIACSWFV